MIDEISSLHLVSMIQTQAAAATKTLCYKKTESVKKSIRRVTAGTCSVCVSYIIYSRYTHITAPIFGLKEEGHSMSVSTQRRKKKPARDRKKKAPNGTCRRKKPQSGRRWTVYIRILFGSQDQEREREMGAEKTSDTPPHTNLINLYP